MNKDKYTYYVNKQNKNRTIMHNIEIRIGIGRIDILHLERKGYKGTDNQLSSILLFCQQEA